MLQCCTVGLLDECWNPLYGSKKKKKKKKITTSWGVPTNVQPCNNTTIQPMIYKFHHNCCEEVMIEAKNRRAYFQTFDTAVRFYKRVMRVSLASAMGGEGENKLKSGWAVW